MNPKTLSPSLNKTLILVHGAGHGSWSWKKITPALEAKGYHIVSLDLPSSGNDTDFLANVTFYDDVTEVINAAYKVEGKVTLIGHSSGGVVISQAAESLGLEKVDKLIYIDAFLPQNGDTVFSIAGKIRESKKDTTTAKADTGQPRMLIHSEDKKSFKWNPELVEQLFYHDNPEEDVIFAKAHLSWQAFSALTTPVQLSDTVYGAIKKYYIASTEAKNSDKSILTTFVHCEKLYKLPSSHTPFFSMPDRLIAIIEEIENLPA